MHLRHRLLRHLFKAPMFRGRDRLIGLIANSYSTPRTTLTNGLLMELEAGEWIQLEIIAKGGAEPRTLELMNRLLREGDVAVDVGAHVGHHALIAARACGRSGRVIAIDPQPYNADRIARNADLNGFSTIQTICAAAGQADGFVSIPLQSTTDRARLSLAMPSPNDRGCLIDVPIRRLDSLFAAKAISRVKLLKIDVEGYELECIEGLGDRIVDCEHLIFELLDETSERKTETLIQRLKDSRYNLYDLDGNPWTQGVPLPEHNCWAYRP